jgi:hypothetical protein
MRVIISKRCAAKRSRQSPNSNPLCYGHAAKAAQVVTHLAFYNFNFYEPASFGIG